MTLKWIALLTALLLSVVSAIASDSHIDSLYLESEFQQVIDSLQAQERDSLLIDDELLLIKSLSRIGRGYKALRCLNDVTSEPGSSNAVLVSAAIVYQSLGRFREAMEFADSALRIDPRDTEALLTRATIQLSMRDFNGARSVVQKAIDIDSTLIEFKLNSDIAVYVYSACGNASALADLHRQLAELYEHAGRSTDAYAARMNSHMYAEVAADMFTIEADSDYVVLPLMRLHEGHPHRYIPLNIDGSTYRVLIDTGNRLGWTVHDRSLQRLLVSKQGGAFTTSSAIMRRNIPGRYVQSNCVGFGQFKIHSAVGVSFRKIRPDFPDAILNPVFIRDRVVTLDLVSDRLVLRSKERFERDMQSDSTGSVISVPYLGYRWPYIPVTVNGRHKGIAMIETGSSASWLRQGFAEANGIAESRDSQGYSVTMAAISVGGSQIADGKIRVASMRYCDPVTGLVESVLLHAGVFDRRYVLTFDPFDNLVILQRE